MSNERSLLVPGEDNHQHRSDKGGRHDQEFPGVFHDGGLGRRRGFGRLLGSLGLGSFFGFLLVGFGLGQSGGINRSFFSLLF